MADYQLIPVDHNPFVTGFEPVDHDPFADEESALASTMTHKAQGPNPAAPYLDMARDYFQGGVPQVLRNRGVELPGWVGRLDNILQNPDNLAAIGAGMSKAAAGALGGAVRGAMKTSQSIWANPEKTEKLQQLMAQGKSFSQIGDELGVSRSAIAGKVNSLRGYNNKIRAARANADAPDARVTSSLPRFNLSEDASSGDPEYEKALRAYLKF